MPKIGQGRRRHRLVVEFTTSHQLSESSALHGLQNLLEDLDLDRRPLWASSPSVYAEKITVKRYTKVSRALAKRKAPRHGWWMP